MPAKSRPSAAKPHSSKKKTASASAKPAAKAKAKTAKKKPAKPAAPRKAHPDALAAYHAKRDFQKTAEPAGRKARPGGHRFVIQKHDASRLHYDFRLEVGGTLKSWAVPKGIPFTKGEKHLAVQVEDHPLDYGGFEGIIPKGQYGGGTVMLWDTGTFTNLGGDAAKDLAAGKLHFALEGKKLHGEWTLIRIQRGDGNEWLLLKSGDDVKPLAKTRDDESSLSGRTMAQIAREHDAEWQSKPRARSAAAPKRLLRAARAPRPLKFVEPMKATLVSAPPTHGEWSYEIKFDGYRALALKNGSNLQLLSRNQKDFAPRFPEIAEAVAGLAEDRLILDGEIVALQPDGIPSFQLLQSRELGRTRPPLAYYVFDLLQLGPEDLTSLPLEERRARLEQVIHEAGDPIRFSGTLPGAPDRLLEEMRRRGLEGLIGKEKDSRYEVGRRSASWIKLKCVHEQEFVIGGYTPPEGARQHFGALLVGVYEGKSLRFCGKTGTGFTAALLARLHRQMRVLAQKECPFANLPERAQGRWQQNITPREMSRCHWIEPRLVCQIRFTEWTDDGKLRHPAFIALREDKPPHQVTRERPA